MTVRWTVSAATTEQRSKAEIKTSALRRSDETESCHFDQTKKDCYKAILFIC